MCRNIDSPGTADGSMLVRGLQSAIGKCVGLSYKPWSGPCVHLAASSLDFRLAKRLLR
jgi:hypothetical protein